jgi:outer membrane protein OmpA-like peptidoglycan-associated protein
MKRLLSSAGIVIALIAVTMLIACAPQTPPPPSKPAPPPTDTIFLEELAEQKELAADQKSANAQIMAEYNQRKTILTRIETEDQKEQTQIVQKREEIAAQEAQLKQEIEQKLFAGATAIASKDVKVQELLDKDLSSDELARRLEEETSLTKEEIREVVEAQRVRKLVDAAETPEELEAVLRRETNLKDSEIQSMVAMRRQVIEKEQELRQDTIKRIYDRLVRNRELNIESVFCSGSSRLDQLVMTPVYFPFDVHIANREQSTKLLTDYDKIKGELANYPDMALQLEGNTDYVGSNRYNKALGDRRASGVIPLMISLGYPPNKLRSISNGEECPTPRIDDEEKWRAENRRTDFIWVLQ